jgi:hypothetical protein
MLILTIKAVSGLLNAFIVKVGEDYAFIVKIGAQVSGKQGKSRNSLAISAFRS